MELLHRTPTVTDDNFFAICAALSEDPMAYWQALTGARGNPSRPIANTFIAMATGADNNTRCDVLMELLRRTPTVSGHKFFAICATLSDYPMPYWQALTGTAGTAQDSANAPDQAAKFSHQPDKTRHHTVTPPHQHDELGFSLDPTFTAPGPNNRFPATQFDPTVVRRTGDWTFAIPTAHDEEPLKIPPFVQKGSCAPPPDLNALSSAWGGPESTLGIWGVRQSSARSNARRSRWDVPPAQGESSPSHHSQNSMWDFSPTPSMQGGQYSASGASDTSSPTQGNHSVSHSLWDIPQSLKAACSAQAKSTSQTQRSSRTASELRATVDKPYNETLGITPPASVSYPPMDGPDIRCRGNGVHAIAPPPPMDAPLATWHDYSRPASLPFHPTIPSDYLPYGFFPSANMPAGPMGASQWPHHSSVPPQSRPAPYQSAIFPMAYTSATAPYWGHPSRVPPVPMPVSYPPNRQSDLPKTTEQDGQAASGPSSNESYGLYTPPTETDQADDLANAMAAHTARLIATAYGTKTAKEHDDCKSDSKSAESLLQTARRLKVQAIQAEMKGTGHHSINNNRQAKDTKVQVELEALRAAYKSAETKLSAVRDNPINLSIDFDAFRARHPDLVKPDQEAPFTQKMASSGAVPGADADVGATSVPAKVALGSSNIALQALKDESTAKDHATAVRCKIYDGQHKRKGESCLVAPSD